MKYLPLLRMCIDSDDLSIVIRAPSDKPAATVANSLKVGMRRAIAKAQLEDVAVVVEPVENADHQFKIQLTTATPRGMQFEVVDAKEE